MNKTKTRPIEIPAYFDYLDAELLKRYMNYFGQIKPRNRTGLSQKQQAALARAVKRARHLALIPFVTEYIDLGRQFKPRGGDRRNEEAAAESEDKKGKEVKEPKTEEVKKD
jgi:ribosomal protein S18